MITSLRRFGVDVFVTTISAYHILDQQCNYQLNKIIIAYICFVQATYTAPSRPRKTGTDTISGQSGRYDPWSYPDGKTYKLIIAHQVRGMLIVPLSSFATTLPLRLSAYKLDGQDLCDQSFSASWETNRPANVGRKGA